MKRFLFTVAVACLSAAAVPAADPPATTTQPVPTTGPVITTTTPTVVTTTGTTQPRRMGLIARLRNRMGTSTPSYSAGPVMTAPATVVPMPQPSPGPGTAVPTPMPSPGTTGSTTPSGVVTAGGVATTNGVMMSGGTVTTMTVTEMPARRMGLIARLRARR